MKNIWKPVAGIAAACAPHLAMAGAPSVIVDLGPASPTQVPTLSGGLLIALGVLLLVVGIRFLRQRELYQKIFSVLLLGGGLLAGSFGVDRSAAIFILSVPPDSPACSGNDISLNTGVGPYSGIPLLNECPSTTLEVKGYQNLPCPHSLQIISNADIGDTIAPGATVTTNYCPPPT